MDFDGLLQAQTGLGTAALIVMDKSVSVRLIDWTHTHTHTHTHTPKQTHTGVRCIALSSCGSTTDKSIFLAGTC